MPLFGATAFDISTGWTEYGSPASISYTSTATSSGSRYEGSVIELGVSSTAGYNTGGIFEFPAPYVSNNPSLGFMMRLKPWAGGTNNFGQINLEVLLSCDATPGTFTNYLKCDTKLTQNAWNQFNIGGRRDATNITTDIVPTWEVGGGSVPTDSSFYRVRFNTAAIGGIANIIEVMAIWKDVFACPHIVILTVDDTYLTDYTQILPLLVQHDLKATFNVITGIVGTGAGASTRCTWSQLREMKATGRCSFGTHTVDHPNSTTLISVSYTHLSP